LAKLPAMTALPDRATCAVRDAADPLAHLRDAFVLPDGVIYLDGNSLGPLPRAVRERLGRTVDGEWGEGLIRSWNAAGWIDLPRRAGDKIARLVGARPGEVVCADSTSVNLFKLLVAALRLRPGRRAVLSERGNFPTDLYVAEGALALLGGHELKLVGADEVSAAIDADTACVLLTHVDFRSGRMHDLKAVTEAAHRAGALVIWDLAHSAGAVSLDLAGADADFAVGCGYKYLNGGPGAPAFLYVRGDLQARLAQPLTGWMGHARPFDFAPDYAPAPGIGRALAGTPPILSLAALDAALDLWDGVDMAELRAKSVALAELFIALVEGTCTGLGLALASPREAARRGSQVSFRHAEGYAVMQALIARGVIGDFRAPDLLRFGFAPLYLRFVDVFDAAAALREVLAGRAYDSPAFRRRAKVT
jgi:kynureninase